MTDSLTGETLRDKIIRNIKIESIKSFHFLSRRQQASKHPC